ncbi:MAG: hypothetical protein FGM54_04385 [Chitinophagaceae bacterium]|nr:hypothetical protein [Chitinophagaceae bacterium]
MNKPYRIFTIILLASCSIDLSKKKSVENINSIVSSNIQIQSEYQNQSDSITYKGSIKYVRAKFLGIEVGDYVHNIFIGDDNVEYDSWDSDLFYKINTNNQDPTSLFLGKKFDIYYHIEKINLSESSKISDFIDICVVDRLSLVN